MKNVSSIKSVLKIILIVNIYFINIQYTKGQTANYIPPSPTSSSLASLADVQVGEYTGVPNISIPIYKIQSGDISLPISLKYNASGIKVEQEASWVGLGWSLDAGGCITRQIRGKDDFAYNGYLVTDTLPPSTSSNLPQWGTPMENFDYISKYNDIADGTLDGEPDIFYYNFNGKSGKLVCEKQSGNDIEATPFSQNNMLFKYNLITKEWEVTDEKGVKYYFGTHELTKDYSWFGSSRYTPTTCYTGYDNFIKITAWYLDRIESPNGFQVNFFYDDIYNQTISQVQRSELTYYLTDLNVIEASGDGYFSPRFQGRISRHTASMQEVDDVYLEAITFNNGKLVFDTDDRLDIASSNSNKPQKLDKIKLYNQDNDLLKTYDFRYSYFNQNYFTTDKIRLKLDSLKEIALSDSLPAYKFSYNSTSLPSKTSYSIDHWGYYNGKNNENVRQYNHVDVKDYLETSSGIFISLELGTTTEKTMIPYIEFKQDTNIFFGGANREPDAIAMKSAILSKVMYPTSGYTEFEYEPNQFSSLDSLYSDTTYNISLTFSGDYLEESFTLTENSQVYLDYIFADGRSGIPDTYSSAVAVLKKSNGNKVVEFKPGSNNFITHISVCLPPGSYVLYVDCPIDEYDYQNITAKYKKKIYNTNVIGGGLRISKIIDFDKTGDTIRSVKYDYEDSGVSTGRLMSPLKYFYNESLIGAYIGIHPGNVIKYIYQADYIVRTSYSAIPFGNSAQGNYIGYDQVAKSLILSNGVSNGKTVYYFYNTPEERAENFMPAVPNHIFNSNGYLKRIEDYDRSNNLIKKKTFGYIKETNLDINIKGVKTYRFYGDGINDDDVSSTEVRFYDNNIEWWHPIADTTYIYSSDGSSNYLSTINKYYFDNSTYRLLTRKTSETSDGDSIMEIIQYPFDLTYGCYPQMTSNNMLDYPIEKTYYKKDKYVDSELVSYKFENYNYVPDKMYMLEIGSGLTSFDYFDGVAKDNNYSLTEETNYSIYNNRGRPLQVAGKNGRITSYIWGYNNQYPVVKAENISSSILASAVNSAAISTGATDIDDLLYDIGDMTTSTQINKWKDFFAYLRNNASLTGVQVSTFSYNPLYGITSETYPTGVTTYYEYDKFGRLEYIKNDDGKLLKKYEYNYANQ